MRLIDADALETKAKTIYMEFENVAVPSRVIPFSELYLAPTIDAEPVRHGWWEHVDTVSYYNMKTVIEEKCSFCGRYIQRFEDVESEKYCPTCGTKMDAKPPEDMEGAGVTE